MKPKLLLMSLRSSLVCAFALVGLIGAEHAGASFHTFQIEQVYSDAAAKVQFIVLHESQGADGQNQFAGHTLTSTQGTTTRTYVFPDNLPGESDPIYGGGAPTANRRVLVATQSFATLGLITPDFVVPDGFVPLSNGTINYALVDQVTYSGLPADGLTALARSGQAIPNVATNFGGQSASVSVTAALNYEGLWWNSPAGSESGWGINLAHQGDVIFATWFTYDAGGRAWWLSATANKVADGTYMGTLAQTTGPAYDTVPFDPAQVTSSSVGSATLSFSNANNGTFSYVVNGIMQSKAITRQLFGPPPTCLFGSQTNLVAATNYQDLWWAAPAASESGWGINLTQQGDVVFATWFTYDHDHAPLWLSATAPKTADRTYSGTLFKTSGPSFNAFDPSKIVLSPVGSLSLMFSDGNDGAMTYTVNGVAGSKAITRQVFRAPGTVCQ